MRLCTAAEWSAACGGSTYPYGASYNANTCNGHDFDADSLVAGNQDIPAPTGNMVSCAVATIFDMSGNVAEWTNDFRTRLSDNRAVYTLRGGAYDNIAGGLTCGFNADVVPEDFAFPNTGFRCCATGTCAAGQADCGAPGCKTLGNDTTNCGFCGHTCTAGQNCCNGVCTTGACPALP